MCACACCALVAFRAVCICHRSQRDSTNGRLVIFVHRGRSSSTMILGLHPLEIEMRCVCVSVFCVFHSRLLPDVRFFYSNFSE